MGLNRGGMRVSNTDNYLKELEEIKKSISETERKISTIKGRTDSIQEETRELRNELADMGYTFNSIDDIEAFKEEKEERINELIRNYKSELS